MIKFWRTRDNWGAFSNFYRAAIMVDGVRYSTTEHFYQAQKFLEPEIQKFIREQRTPREAVDQGRRRDLPLRPDWEQVSEDVMRRALRAKFDQHPKCRLLLLATGEEKIVEDSPTDYYWGCGADGSGKNRLGELLMELREWYKEHGNDWTALRNWYNEEYDC